MNVVRHFPYLVPVILILISCSTSEPMSDTRMTAVPPASFYQVDGALEPEDSLEQWLAPYRRELEHQMNRRVAVASKPIRYGQPESALGNLTADMVRYRAAHEMERFVHLALLDPVLFGAELHQGVITVGDLYELIPANETLMVLEVEGRIVRKLADEIAAAGGIPLSGMRMVINGSLASSIVIDYGALDETETYYLATGHSLLSNGRFSSLREYRSRTDHDLLLRELMVDYLRSHRVIEPFEDLRVRIR